MSIQTSMLQQPQTGIPSLQELCAAQIRKGVDKDLGSPVGHALTPKGPSSLSLTTAWFMDVLPFIHQTKGEDMGKLPGALMELIKHPYVLVEWQKQNRVWMEKEGGGQPCPEVVWETECVWRRLCEDKGWLPKKDEPEMTWESRYFKERLALAMMKSFGNFEKIDLADWYLFNANKTRVHALDFDKNPWIEKGKLKELCTLFNEITLFRINQCSGMQERDWVETFSKLEKVVHVDLGLHMSIGDEALNALAKNASNLRSLNIASIAYSVELQAIINLLHSSPKLNALVLGEKKHLQNLPELLKVLSSCPSLNSLELQGFKNLKVSDVNVMLNQFPKIEKLVIKNCPEFKSSDLVSFAGHPQIKALEVIDCKNFDPEEGFVLSQKCSNLEKFLCAHS